MSTTPMSKTVWSDPAEIIESGYGKITMQEWCEKECERFRSKGRLTIVDKWQGKVAVVDCGPALWLDVEDCVKPLEC